MFTSWVDNSDCAPDSLRNTDICTRGETDRHWNIIPGHSVATKTINQIECFCYIRLDLKEPSLQSFPLHYCIWITIRVTH